MSTSCQGDQIGEMSKDDELEISSTTSENEGLKKTTGESDENSVEAVALNPETSEPVKTLTNDFPLRSEEKLDTEAVLATTTAETQASLDTRNESSEMKVDTGCDDENTGVSPAKDCEVSNISLKARSTGLAKETADVCLLGGILKQIPEQILTETDKDSSIEEDLELTWEDDENEDNDATELVQADDVLKMLDNELGEDAPEKLDTSEKQTIEVQDTEINKIAIDSFEENQENIADIDSFMQDEMEKTNELLTVRENPVTVDVLDKQLEVIKKPDVEVDLNKSDIEESKPLIAANELSSKPLSKNDEVMDVDDVENIKEDKEIKEEKEITKEAKTDNSFEESQKIIDEIDSLTQDDEIDILPTESDKPLTVELDKQHVDVEMTKNELNESERLDIDEAKLETVSILVSSKSLTEGDKVMDVDDSDNIVKNTSNVDDTAAEGTNPEVQILVSVDKDEDKKVDSILNKAVLDDVNITEASKPAETVTSVLNIPSTDISIIKDITTIPINDEQNNDTNTTDTSKVLVIQPFDDKYKESDASDTKELDDKLPTVQSLNKKCNDSQEIDDTASKVQENKNPSNDKDSSMQQFDDKTSEVQEIAVKSKAGEEKLDENDSIPDDSLLDTTISPNKHHRINKPNVMLDIPTQDLSDIEAELSDSEINDEITKPEVTTENKEKSAKTDENTSEPNTVVNITPEVSGITTATIEIDATTSKLNITTVSPLKLKKTSSTDIKIDDKSSIKMQDDLIDDENVAEKSSNQVEKSQDDKPSSSTMQVEDQQPSTSKNIGDNADDVQESDSLGLLAESSRVMDDDIDDDEEEPEEPEPDDNEDDEDFDPYDESSSQMLEDIEVTDESNPPTEAKEKSNETDVVHADEQMDKQTEKQPDKIINILEKVLGNFTDLKPPTTMSGNVLNYVEVEGSSNSDDVQEVSKPEDKDLVSVKVPAEVDVMLTSGSEGGTSEMHSNKGEVVISVPKPHAQKVAKINTSEVTIKSGSKNLESIQIPETTNVSEKKVKGEVFNIDSDEEEEDQNKIEETPVVKDKENSPEHAAKSRKCINPHCTTPSGVYSKASRATVAYYSQTRRSGAACRACTEQAGRRSHGLVNGIKDLRPLLALDMDAPSHQLVEISDSDEDEEPVDDSEKIGEGGAKFLLDNLVDVFNETWFKYNLDSRLKQTETYLMNELELIEAGAKELDAMLDACQLKTDAIRTDFYKDYEPKRKFVGGIVIHDTPFSSYSHTEDDIESVTENIGSRYPKRRSASTISDQPSKKQALPPDTQGQFDQSKMEDDKDISVVKLSAESAPASLPPHGELVRPALHVGMTIYAMRNAFGTWNKAKILEIVQEASPSHAFTQCKVKFEHKVKNSCKVLAARCLAYSEPSEVRYTIGTRVIALFKDPQSARLDAFYAGVVAEIPNPVNNYRYLVFFDDGYAQYIQHADTRLVCQASALVWEEVHPFIHDFVKNYLKGYPERPMVRLRTGETLNTEWNGKWWSSRVLQVDASIALIHFDQDDRTEWIYRGSTRLEPLYLELQAAKAGGRSRLRLPRTKQIRSNMPCVEYTRSDEQANAKAAAEAQAQQRQAEELRRQRAVAKKSTTDRQASHQQTVIQGTPFEGVISRVVYYTPKHAVKPPRMAAHVCNPSCGKRPDLLTLQDLRTYNPLAKPLLSGWERQTVRYKGHREVMYRAPCGRRLRNMPELHRYLGMLQSDLSVDLFDFTPGTHCLAEFVLNKCIVGKKDLSHGKENVPVPCVNYYDDSLPEFCSYNTERTPTAGVPLNLDPDFLCGCDCTDDCQDKSKCACWKMTLEGARTIGLEGDNIGYVYRRLPEPLPSGIYECNSRCKCKQTCLNRVAQHPLQLKLQVFKTMNRGWGIRALNDVPKGSFLCVYAGNLLTDATANLDGLNEGDEYLAELDYIEVVEGMKEGYEEDIPEADKALDKKGAARSSGSESEPSSESEEEKEGSGKDDDFQPSAYIPQPQGGVYFQKSLRKREKAKKKEERKEKEAAKKRDDCITISDDEEVREPSRFTADDIADKDRKQSSRVSVRTLFGKDEACYIMDAKVQGNIGRYLNHSCHPNVFVQNVFVDTHDPRFPWVAFFALANVRAGNELTWNYNYDVGSVPGKVLYCYCGAPNCRGRLL